MVTPPPMASARPLSVPLIAPVLAGGLSSTAASSRFPKKRDNKANQIMTAAENPPICWVQMPGRPQESYPQARDGEHELQQDYPAQQHAAVAQDQA